MLQKNDAGSELAVLSLREREKYEHVWKIPQYRVKAHGLALWLARREIFGSPVSALDIGCGHGRLFQHWNETGELDGFGLDFAHSALDPAVAVNWLHKFRRQCIWEMSLNRVFDLGVAADVMEHIPEAAVPEALLRMKAHCRVLVMKIANFPSNSLGFDLHPTQRPADWWAKAIGRHGAPGTVELLPYRSNRPEYLFRWSRS